MLLGLRGPRQVTLLTLHAPRTDCGRPPFDDQQGCLVVQVGVDDIADVGVEPVARNQAPLVRNDPMPSSPDDRIHAVGL